MSMLRTSPDLAVAKPIASNNNADGVSQPQIAPPTQPRMETQAPRFPKRLRLFRKNKLQELKEDLQREIWERLMARVATVSDVVQPHRLPSENDFVKPIPAERRYPGLVGAPLIFSEQTPVSERHSPLEAVAIRVALWLKEWYAEGKWLLDPYATSESPYPEIFARIQPRPVVPEDFKAQDKLAGVARRGPFSIQTKRVGEGEYVIDLSGLENLQPRAPFIPTGGVARFVRADDGTLRTVQLDFRGTTVRPGEPGWTLAEKRFLSGLNSYTTFVEHLVNLHIATAGVWGIVGRMAFSTRHPLRVLLQPFTEETNRVNNYNIDGLILSGASNVPMYSGYSLEQSNVLLRNAALGFDVRLMDPEYRATAQGTINDPSFPTVASAVAVFGIYKRFTSEWVRAYLKEIDLETRIFCQELDFRVANGVRRLIGIESWDELTLEHVAHLLAVGAFAASVGHHIVNDLTRNYFMCFDLMAPAIDQNGHSILGVVLEKQSSIFTAGIQRYRLMAPPAVPDDLGRQLWARFHAELTTYERGLAHDPDTEPYCIHPSVVSSSIHA